MELKQSTVQANLTVGHMSQLASHTELPLPARPCMSFLVHSYWIPPLQWMSISISHAPKPKPVTTAIKLDTSPTAPNHMDNGSETTPQVSTSEILSTKPSQLPSMHKTKKRGQRKRLREIFELVNGERHTLFNKSFLSLENCTVGSSKDMLDSKIPLVTEEVVSKTQTPEPASPPPKPDDSIYNLVWSMILQRSTYIPI